MAKKRKGLSAQELGRMEAELEEHRAALRGHLAKVEAMLKAVRAKRSPRQPRAKRAR